jgi:hypothetical protein
MKALDQIASTGVPLDAKHVYAADASYEFVISQAGSYFLAGNLDVGKGNGIHVTVPGVTIELNGYEIRRRVPGSGEAIVIDATAHRCVIKNGSITGFSIGVDVSFGAKGGAFRNLAVAACANFGVGGGNGWLIEACTFHDNGDGISAGGSNVTISRCSAYNNAGIGIIATGGGSIVIDSTSSGNTGAGGGGVGIEVSQSTVINCAASNNQTDGIQAKGGCIVLNNTCIGNGASTAVGAGILVDSTGNRIESNNLLGNDFGLKANSGGNLIIKNSTRGNGNSFNLVAGNSVGEQINVYNGGAGATITTSNSWANLLY